MKHDFLYLSYSFYNNSCNIFRIHFGKSIRWCWLNYSLDTFSIVCFVLKFLFVFQTILAALCTRTSSENCLDEKLFSLQFVLQMAVQFFILVILFLSSIPKLFFYRIEMGTGIFLKVDFDYVCKRILFRFLFLRLRNR